METWPPARSFWDSVRVLRQFEGWQCLWRVPVAGFLLYGRWALPFAGFVAGAYLARDLGNVLLVGAGGVAAVGSGLLATEIGRRRPWQRIVADRLWSYEQPNPAAMVPVLVRDQDYEQVCSVVRRAKLNPAHALRSGSSPPDAPELTVKLDVVEPARWQRTSSDPALVRQVVEIFRRAGLAARIAGIDVNRSS